MGWAAAIGVASRPLFLHENTPGASGSPATSWPAHAALGRARDKFTLVMFAHPDCPCTRASLAELELLMAQLPGKLDAAVEFRKPGVSETEARMSPSWRQAAAIPGVAVRLDRDGASVQQFGAAVSGHTLLYDPSGRLVFSGGITAARGHIGDNPGYTAILNRVRGFEAPLQARVFGCSLADPDEPQLRQDSLWKK
jgi:hypothetical protein